MIRFVVIALAVALLAYLLVLLGKAVRRADPDWGGVLFCCAFVALAFYLRHATGMG